MKATGRTALVVFPLHPSHGCILQTFALSKKLECFSKDVDIIDLQWQIEPKKRFKRSLRNLIHKMQGSYKGTVFYNGVVSPEEMQNLRAFIREYLGSNVKTIYSEEQLAKINWRNYNAVIVGSDQTWRPKYVPNIYHFFLDFVSKDVVTKRISYAASFGTETWEYNQEQEERCRYLINLFDAVSVREQSGVELCKRYFNKGARHVLDPTLLFTGEEYIKMLSLSEDQGDFIAAYWLDKTKEKDEILGKIKSFFRYDVVEVNQLKEGHETSKGYTAPSIQTWLQKNLSARFVLVDSFHAMVFAILFHKQFLVIGNESRGLSRFESLLSQLGLAERLLHDDSVINEDIINKPINWDFVESKLSLLRIQSLSFLKDALG